MPSLSDPYKGGDANRTGGLTWARCAPVRPGYARYALSKTRVVIDRYFNSSLLLRTFFKYFTGESDDRSVFIVDHECCRTY